VGKNARYPKGFRASLFILVTPLLGLRESSTWYSSTSRTVSGGLKFHCWRTDVTALELIIVPNNSGFTAALSNIVPETKTLLSPIN